MENLSLFHALHEYKVTTPVSSNNVMVFYDIVVQVTRSLSWDERVKILNLTACAVLYLHSSSPPCVHRDIKS